ncbi:hypothetical protein ACH4SK_30895 [Streptomyces inhibens]|uniref:hypothetical protein n=1 Tax=Streptomyces inhibens TaxID=2293571 RepID=UPI0037BC9211
MGEDTLLKDWYPALCDGIRRAGGPLPSAAEVAVGFYGDLFRLSGRALTVGEPRYTAADVEEGFEQDLLMAWWESAARAESSVAPPGAGTLVRTPRAVQTALRALSGSRFFSRLAMRALVSDLKQVRLYLMDQHVRESARTRVAALIDDDTRVVVGHSLGSVVAYEALCASPGHRVRAFVTLGSPLGIPMIYKRLMPEPGRWPGGSGLTWTNVADEGDVVALVKDLRPVFDERIRSVVVNNGVHAHDASPYLTERLTGAAIAGGLDAV